MARVKKKPDPVEVECPVCHATRTVSAVRHGQIRRGLVTGRCEPCFRKEMAAKAREEQPPQACRHCAVPVAGRPRGLCHKCYDNRRVRAMYPPDAKPTYRFGEGNVTVGKPASKPTSAAPGTEQKILVMMARAARGEALFHPEDCKTMHDTAPDELLAALGGVAKRGHYKPKGKKA